MAGMAGMPQVVWFPGYLYIRVLWSAMAISMAAAGFERIIAQ